MHHFCWSMTGYKNTPVFTPWMSSSKSISRLDRLYLPSAVVCAYTKHKSLKFIKALFLKNCASGWACMYIMSSQHSLWHQRYRSNQNINKTKAPWCKHPKHDDWQPPFVYYHPMKIHSDQLIELSPQISVVTFQDLFIIWGSKMALNGQHISPSLFF